MRSWIVPTRIDQVGKRMERFNPGEIIPFSWAARWLAPVDETVLAVWRPNASTCIRLPRIGIHG